MADLHVQGLSELHKALQNLPSKIERNILRGGLRAGAKVMQQAAQAQVPVKSGALRKSIRIKTSARRGVVKATVVAGSRQAYYAHMVEFGTAAHFIKPKNRKSLFFAGLAREVVDHPGAKPEPFMRPALDSSQQAATTAMADYIRQRLAKEGLK